MVVSTLLIVTLIYLAVGSISPMGDLSIDDHHFVNTPVVLYEQQEEEQEEKKNYKVVQARISGYAPYDNQSGICNDGDILTSRGKPASRQYVAVAPSLIPYGSKIEIKGFDGETFIAGDTGGVMRNKASKGIYAIDVFFESYEEAMRFGIQWREVKIYK